VLPIREYSEDHFIFLATQSGTVKKTPLVDYSRPRANGIIALDLRDGDRLIGVALTNGEREIMLLSDSGKAIRFPEAQARSMGRVACGVRGIRLRDGQKVIALGVTEPESDSRLLIASENGYGKQTQVSEFPLQKRGGQGVIAMQTSERNGAVVGATLVNENDEVMLITSGGVLVRTSTDEISVVGRNTQGVRLIKLGKKELLVEIERIENLNEDGDNDQDSIESDSDEE
jgi:DNA gyrase subunit A